MNYQEKYSEHFPAVKDVDVRLTKARKILTAVLSYFQRDDLQGFNCLDMGCSVGVISRVIANAGASVFGLDIDINALEYAKTEYGDNLNWVAANVEYSPFVKETFDLIVCSQVYEHVPHVDLLVNEILRLLSPTGVCYFSGPNRWAIIEHHYGIPFLSWVPKSWANVMLIISGRGKTYYENPRSAGELRNTFTDFKIHDLTPQLLKHPDRYGFKPSMYWVRHFARRTPFWMWKYVGKIVPNFNWLLTKKKDA